MASAAGNKSGGGSGPAEQPAGPPAEQLAVAVGRSVMRALGRPTDFLRATARAVGGDAYRVNVLTGPDGNTARIAHSYYVTADGDGRVVGSSPALTRLYPD